MDDPAADDIFHSALELSPQERVRYLDRACAADVALREDVESLLRVYERHPPPALVEATALAPERVGRYPILGELGRGGMGRVYLAEDPALGRRVALKLLPARLFNETEQSARFQREAQILASVSHPNVATLYSLEEADGAPFLTMELVLGESLAVRIASLPSGTGLGVSEVVHLGLQMARGLRAAHERGVVHRDLKPANVVVSPKGEVKILDFGLAKVMSDAAAEPTRAEGGDSASATPGSPGDTRPGGILGSPGYMSPEQIRGEPASASSDLWAFGCVLYECLTGRAAFPGDTADARVSSTLGAEPDWTALPTRLPSHLRGLVQACLVKDPSARPASAEQLCAELERITAELGGRGRMQRTARLAAAGALAGALLWVVVDRPGVRPGSPSSSDRGLRQVTFTGDVLQFEISPDDRFVAYTSSVGGLVIHEMAGGAYRVIHRASGLSDPHWSPDGTEILVTAPAERQNVAMSLVRAVDGTVVSFGPGNCRGLGWTSDGTAVLAANPDSQGRISRLLLVRRATGDTTSVPLTAEIGLLRGVRSSHTTGSILLWGLAADGEPTGWITTRLGGSLHRVLPERRSSYVQWSADGRDVLCLTVQDDLYRMERVSIDHTTGRVKGPAVDLGVLDWPSASAFFRQSDRVLYHIGPNRSALWVMERGADGEWIRRRLHSGSLSLRQPRLSPDGRFVALGQQTETRSSIGVFSLLDGSCRQFPSIQPAVRWTAWSPDGTRVAFQAGAGSGSRVYGLEPASGEIRVLSDRSCHGYVYWSPDDRIRFQPATECDRNYTLLDPVTGMEEPLFPAPLRGTVFQSAVSPDNEWLVVAGNRNGILGVAVWLIRLSDRSERILYEQSAVPVGWSRDGLWVYLVQAVEDGASRGLERNRVLRVSVRDGAAEPVAELPEGDLVYWSDVDISLDGDRIVVAVRQLGSDLWIAEGAATPR